MSLLELNVRIHSWWVALAHRARDQRGNNSIEMAIIIGVVIVVATLIGVAIKSAVDSRLPGLK